MSYTGTISLVQPAAQRIFQRDTRTGGLHGLGAGTVGIAINLSAPASLLEYQLRDANAPATIIAPWSTAATGLPSGPQTLGLNVPAATAWYFIDLRANSDPGSVVSTSNKVGVGEVVAAAGQSLATDFWSTAANGDPTTLAALGVNASPYSSALAAWDGGSLPTSSTAWSTPSDNGPYLSAFVAEFLRLVVSATGVNAALVGYGHSGTDIGTYWLPGLPDYANLSSVLNASGGKFGTFIWCQGHNDADARSGPQYHLTPAPTYLQYLNTLFGALAAAFPATSWGRILCAIPAIAPAAAAKYSPQGIEAIRGAHLQYVASTPGSIYVDGLDIALMADGIHPSQAGNVTFARHFYRAFMSIRMADPTASSWPALAGVASRGRGSAAVALPLRQPAASPLISPGDPRTQFQVFPSGQTSGALPLAGVDLSDVRQITITLAAAPPDTQALDVWYRLPFDSPAALAGVIYDQTAAVGLTMGRPLAIMAAPITARAPSQSWYRPILIGPGVPMLTSTGTIALTV